MYNVITMTLIFPMSAPTGGILYIIHNYVMYSTCVLSLAAAGARDARVR